MQAGCLVLKPLRIQWQSTPWIFRIDEKPSLVFLLIYMCRWSLLQVKIHFFSFSSSGKVFSVQAPLSFCRERATFGCSSLKDPSWSWTDEFQDTWAVQIIQIHKSIMPLAGLICAISLSILPNGRMRILKPKLGYICALNYHSFLMQLRIVSGNIF